jgi:hypothetical protein
MEEIKHEIKTYDVDCICPNCKKGKMRPFGKATKTFIVKWSVVQTHMCSLCEFKADVIDRSYPCTITERVLVTSTES